MGADATRAGQVQGVKWREITEAEHADMLGAARREHPNTAALLAFSDRFCKRPMLVQLPLFPACVGPTCRVASEVTVTEGSFDDSELGLPRQPPADVRQWVLTRIVVSRKWTRESSGVQEGCVQQGVFGPNEGKA